MNPNSSGETQPQIEATPKRSAEIGSDKVIEKRPTVSSENKPERVQQASQVASTMALPGQAVAVGKADDTAADDLTDAAGTPATDTDRIEKEWIDKTQAAVTQTRDDPYEQKKAVSHVKASYIKKRFNKTIKTDDSVSK